MVWYSYCILIQSPHISGKLKVEKLFQEQAGSLYLEGRIAVLKLSTGNDLSLLSKLARCAGADYVKNEGTKFLFND